MPLAGQRITALDFTAAVTATDSNVQANIGTTIGPGTPEVGVVFIAPTSGKVMVSIGGSAADDAGAHKAVIDWQLYAGTNASGTLILNVGSLARRLIIGGDVEGVEADRSSLVTGLTPGSSYYARVMVAAYAATTDVYNRTITVVPLPA